MVALVICLKRSEEGPKWPEAFMEVRGVGVDRGVEVQFCPLVNLLPLLIKQRIVFQRNFHRKNLNHMQQ